MTSADRPPVVFVTGASSGIGRACCERLAAGGWTVVGGSRAATAADRWTSVKLDVRDDQSVRDAVAEVAARHGRIDALVHAAGISIAGAVEDIDLATAQQLFETNYFGTVRMIRAIVPAMRAAGHGRILVIGSIGGLIGLPFLAHYSASKFALVGLVEALRLEIAPFGIDAGIIHPGDIHTNIATNQRVIDGGPASPYSRPRQLLVRAFDDSVASAPPPAVVARAVERALAARRCPPRTVVGRPPERLAVVARKLLRARTFEWLLRRTYGL